MPGVAFPIFWALWVSHGHQRGTHRFSCRPLGCPGTNKFVGKAGITLSWAFFFYPLLHVCLILLWSQWCKRNELGLEWAVNASAMGIRIYSVNTESWWSPELWLSPSLGNPSLSPCLCLPVPSLPSDLHPFTKHRLGALSDTYLGLTLNLPVSKHKELLFQRVNAADLLNYSKERDDLDREPQSDQHF